ncbi:uncharacterized protein METZ01_LOCUS376628, partial [marine metagenome]
MIHRRAVSSKINQINPAYASASPMHSFSSAEVGVIGILETLWDRPCNASDVLIFAHML